MSRERSREGTSGEAGGRHTGSCRKAHRDSTLGLGNLVNLDRDEAFGRAESRGRPVAGTGRAASGAAEQGQRRPIRARLAAGLRRVEAMTGRAYFPGECSRGFAAALVAPIGG